MTVALVLAGGLKPELATSSPQIVEEALIRIGSHYMVEYVVEALRNSPEIKKIIIAGPRLELEEIYQPASFLKIIENGPTTLQSFMHAFRLIPPETQQILAVTSDLPLLTTEAINHFLRVCRSLEGDFFYPIIRREVNEAKYPGVKRTYVHLKEGVFTGGNLLLVKPHVVEKCAWEAEELVRLRKKPFSLLTHLNRKLVLSYLLRRLSIKDVEKEVARLLAGVKGVGVISPYPEIGLDVDKLSDLVLVEKMLCS